MRTLLISVVVVMTGCGAGSTADSADSEAAQFERACSSLGARAFVQGALTTTGLPGDLALDGPGFFVVRDEFGTWFTRDGRFTIDAQGRFAHVATGARLMNIALEDITLGRQLMPPKPTAQIVIHANLDARAPIQVWDPIRPSATSDFSSTVIVFEGLGEPLQVDVFWTRTASGAWEFHAMTDGRSIAGGTAGALSEIASGTLTFDTDGRLDTTAQASNFTPVSAVAPQPLSFSLGDELANGGTGLAGVTQFAGFSATTFVSQNGAPAGVLSNFMVDQGGRVMGSFTNGQTIELAHIATAVFAAPQSLRRRANGMFVATSDSGQAVLGPAGDSVQPSVVGGALEKLPDYGALCVVH